jgi:nucleotide-binding universal stress UspA family protein
MLKHILVALDGTSGSDEILPLLCRLAGLGAQKITLLRADLPVAIDEYSVVTEAVLEQSRRYLEDMKNQLPDLKIPVDILPRIGPPAAIAIETAETEGASMIVIAAPRGNRLVRFLLGSVPERIVQRSPMPVLVVPPRWSYELASATPPDQRPIRNILVPLHGAAAADALLPPVLEIAREANSRLTLAGVISPSEVAPARDAFEDAEEVLYAAGARCAEAGVDFSVVVEYGEPAARIFALCREREVDWIAMATRGRSAFSRWLLPSVTNRILREADRPVLTVRLEPAAVAGTFQKASAPGHS